MNSLVGKSSWTAIAFGEVLLSSIYSGLNFFWIIDTEFGKLWDVRGRWFSSECLERVEFPLESAWNWHRKHDFCYRLMWNCIFREQRILGEVCCRWLRILKSLPRNQNWICVLAKRFLAPKSVVFSLCI